METGAASIGEFDGFLDGIDENSLEIQVLTPESPKKPTIFNNGFDSVSAVIDSVRRLGPGDEWIGAWYTVTDKDFVTEACDAVVRGAHVKLYVDYYTLSDKCFGGKTALEKLAAGGVAVYVFNPAGKSVDCQNRSMLHTKMALITKKVDGKKSVIQGSANLTKAARTVNSEMITYFPNDPEAYASLKVLVDTDIAPYSKELSQCKSIPDHQKADFALIVPGSKVIITPQKGSRVIIPSSQYDIQNILSQRIENTGKNGEIIVLTMTLSSQVIIKSLIKAATNGSRVRMLFDGRGAEKWPPVLWESLVKLCNTGNAQILVSAKKDGLQHAKSIAIMRSPKDYVIATGTGNLVKQDESMVNVWGVMSEESADAFMKVKKIFERESDQPDVVTLDVFKKSLTKRPSSAITDTVAAKKNKS